METKAANGRHKIIVFGRFLLDSMPIKLNEFNGIVEKKLLETARSDERGKDIDGRVEGGEKKRKKDCCTTGINC